MACQPGRVQALEAERNTLKQQVEQLLREKQIWEEQQQQQKAEGQVQAGAGIDVEQGGHPLPVDLNARIAMLQQELHQEQAERRKIHNALVDLKGNVSAWLDTDGVYHERGLVKGEEGALRRCRRARMG